MLSHEHIIKFYGFRKDGHVQYLFLEYACGGELFDRIGKSLNYLRTKFDMFSAMVCKYVS